MDITNTIQKLKQQPDFKENVGMILCHNGVVRKWSRNDKRSVAKLEVTTDYDKIEKLRQEFLESPGIYDIIIDAKEGTFEPGDDLLFMVVAGDIREHIKPVLAELLDRIKAEAVVKTEIYSD